MNEDYQNKRNNTWTRLNALRHFFFGALLMVVAVLLFQRHRIGNFDFGTGGSYAFGGLLLVYGLFRIWRGFADLRNIGND